MVSAARPGAPGSVPRGSGPPRPPRPLRSPVTAPLPPQPTGDPAPRSRHRQTAQSTAVDDKLLGDSQPEINLKDLPKPSGFAAGRKEARDEGDRHRSAPWGRRLGVPPSGVLGPWTPRDLRSCSGSVISEAFEAVRDVVTLVRAEPGAESWARGSGREAVGNAVPFLQSLQHLRSDSPIVILRDVQTAPKASPAAGRKPKTVRLISKNFIRDLVVPAENPEAALVITGEDLQRIKESARVQTKEEREAKLAAMKEKMRAAFEEERKKAEQELNALRQQMQGLSDLEEESLVQNQKLVQKVNRMRMEQEDEIRQFSKLIQGAKCHMIQDMQTLEKQLITRELEEEEKRLTKMMEVEREKANEMQEELERKRKQELIRGRQELVKQMEQNAEERAIRAEQQHEEAQEMLQRLEQMKLEDLKNLERKQEQQKKIQAEIKRINKENERLKEEQREQERMADERVLQYQKQKMEREAELEAEQERLRKEKEKEMARMRAMQERARDLQAEKDALRAKRNQEAAEREWRRKEKAAAQKKAEVEAMLKQSRLEQMAQREHSMAMQMQQDRQEFERIVRMQKEQMEKEKAEEARKTGLRLAHANAVRQQMQERQQELARERVAAFEERRRLEEEARQRSQRIAQLKQQKMQELRASGVPEKYITYVERRAQREASAVPARARPREEQHSRPPLP
ncbi:cilia- and flagella-associated protein 45 [Podargus strigoides]